MSGRLTRSQLIACMDTLAAEIAGKLDDYQRLADDLTRLRAQLAPPENVSRHFDTREFVSNVFPRKRTA